MSRVPVAEVVAELIEALSKPLLICVLLDISTRLRSDRLSELRRGYPANELSG